MRFAKYGPAAAALATYLLFGSLLCTQVPLWIPPDEELHVAYCQYIARNSTLPRAASTGSKEPVIMAFHPPLYYIAGSVFFDDLSERVENIVRIHDGPGYALISAGAENKNFSSSVLRLRFFTLVCGAAIVIAAYASIRVLSPRTVLPAAVGSFFVAANPQLLHVAAGISNEVPAAALSSIFLFMLLLYCRQPLSAGKCLLMGCLLGLSLLTKTSTVFLVPLGFLVIVFTQRRRPARAVRDLALVFGIALIIAGWWYAVNWQTLQTIQTSQPWFNRTAPISFEYLAAICRVTFISFFGFFASQQIALPPHYFIIYALIIVAGMCGVLRAVVCKEYSRPSCAPVLVLITAFAGGAGVFALLNYTYYAPQGKYLYPVIVPVAALVGAGSLCLLNDRQKKTAAVMLSTVMVMVCALALFLVFLPAVQEPRLKRIASQSDFNCITGHITVKQPLIYSFKVSENGLCGIRVLFSKTCETRAGSLLLRLVQQGPDESEVCRILLPVRDIRDSHWQYFGFPPLSNSAGKNFSVQVKAQDISPEARLALWCAQQASFDYNADPLHIDGIGCVPFFEAYAFTGTVPKTIWEGCTTATVREQLYVSVREMQLFSQCLPGSANKEKISRKWHRLEKAAINRQNGSCGPPVSSRR